MSAKLDYFLSEIDPKNCYYNRQDKVMRVLNHHLEDLTSNTVTNETELKECLWFFVENVRFDGAISTPEVDANDGLLTPELHRNLANGFHNSWFWFKMALDLLEKVYTDDQSYQHIPHRNRDPSKDTMKIIEDMMYLGMNGGVSKVLKDLAQAMILDDAAEEIEDAVRSFLNQFDYEEKEELFYEYIYKYPELLPRGFNENLPHLPGTLLEKILEEHPRSLMRIRDIR